MSYSNFIPTVWSQTILRERERQCVAAKLCWKDFEGEVTYGNRVKINGVGRPTVSAYVKNSTTITPENLGDQSTFLDVNQQKYFAFEIDDIDKRQAKGNLMAEQMKEAAAAMAEDADNFIYGLYGEAGNTLQVTNVISTSVLSTITRGMKALWQNNVPATEEVYLEASPSLLEKIILAKIVFGEPNDKTLDNGYQGRLPLMGLKLYGSNGIYNDGTYDYCFLRTKKAIAYVDQIDKTEAYRPESSFSDAVKGLHVYGAKVVRPKELVVLKLTYGNETGI
jgi:hypothetical protein